jgi:uncharacterized membrane-anchored protein
MVLTKKDTDGLNKVPEVRLVVWISKIAATTP